MDNLERLYHEAYRLSEKRLEVQQATALAADSRAMAFAGICLAAAAVLGGLASGASSPVLLLTGAFFLGFAALLSGYSARPVDFYMPGARYSDLSEDITGNVDMQTVMAQLGKFADDHSDSNDKVLGHNAKLFNIALIIAVFGVALAVIPQLLDAIIVASQKP